MTKRDGETAVVKLEPVTRHNIRQLLKLRVHEDQRDFVASNTESIVEAYLALRHL